ncbi:MAG: hypothetical protein C0412_18440 [Flavobacterium sp.]|nr:hypothetical protein [Flavobacterium sp.]
MNKIKIAKITLFFITLAILPLKADAYLDPGTGSYIFQIIAASIFGTLFILKSFWLKIIYTLKYKLSAKNKCEKDDEKKIKN